MTAISKINYGLVILLFYLSGCFNRPSEKEINAYTDQCNASNLCREGLAFTLTGFQIDEMQQVKTIIKNASGTIEKDTVQKLDTLNVRASAKPEAIFGYTLDSFHLNSIITIEMAGKKLVLSDFHLSAKTGNNAMGGAMLYDCGLDSATVNGVRRNFYYGMTLDKKDF
ncbi:hypothetical protein LL912_13700 [Niabella sp. CC-SYL272]|uniref:hypothetical protein n=1 Tax=Niabella agricola TaxID=2891571 RepID=UPI001F252E9E|nr:hypothetical protein [Niabella agricola]MCF3109829.1 hypothetical protein [Niabella agricola]